MSVTRQLTDAPTRGLPTCGLVNLWMPPITTAVNMLNICVSNALGTSTHLPFRIHLLALFQNTYRIKQLLVEAASTS